MMIQRSEREGWAVEGGSAAENARLMRNRGRKGKRDEGLDHGEDRMAYAFSRDGAMSFPPLWHKVNKQEVPINAVWLSIVDEVMHMSKGIQKWEEREWEKPEEIVSK
ncbi:hypothetical protein HHK36_007547 [Tetracentron sinense]|uniref:Uncharacterized protein n=1 Tax=Tetracentron sinense TaxID=13715 RepID=A0A834ZTR1_TETSI|nr:hypothetical protein HHK36_007547 [Tetracentron sinense]